MCSLASLEEGVRVCLISLSFILVSSPSKKSAPPKPPSPPQKISILTQIFFRFLSILTLTTEKKHSSLLKKKRVKKKMSKKTGSLRYDCIGPFTSGCTQDKQEES